jgi:pyrroloquinoline quinone biosynthesis protein D
MTGVAAASRPRLRRGVRLSYDSGREAHTVLFPEGVLLPNRTAVAVLERCDGTATVADIVAALRPRYGQVPIGDVLALLERLVRRHIVEVDADGVEVAPDG